MADYVTPFDCLYDPDDRDRDIFGDAYLPPVRFEHGEWHLVARYRPESEDGQAVEVDELRMPARFYRLRALPCANSVGTPVRGWTLSTGSGDAMGSLLAWVARSVAQGMLSWRDAEGNR